MACNTKDYLKLPEDIWLRIFLRCSVESLLRANCVCKQFHALITNPTFTFDHLHYQKSHNKGHLLVQHFKEETQQFRYVLFDDETLKRDTYHELGHLKLSQEQFQLFMEVPVDGLYCLYNRHGRIVLWNPALMKFRTLPLPHHHFLPHFKVFEGKIGLGKDPLTNGYKLVLIRSFDDTIYNNLSDLYVTVYDFSMDTWRLLDLGGFPLRAMLDNLNTAFLDGVYYWSNFHEIVAFDMGKELFRKISGPDISDSEFSVDHLAIYNEHLALLVFKSFDIDVWVMSDEGVWTKQFSNITHPSEYDMAVGLWKNDGILFATSEKGGSCGNPDSQMVLSNAKTRKTRNVGPRGLLCGYWASVYYESLVSVDCGTEHKGKHAPLSTISDFLNIDYNPYSGIKMPKTSSCASDESGSEHDII